MEDNFDEIIWLPQADEDLNNILEYYEKVSQKKHIIIF